MDYHVCASGFMFVHNLAHFINSSSSLQEMYRENPYYIVIARDSADRILYQK